MSRGPDWRLGYQHGYDNLVASMIAKFPDGIDWGEYNVGYAIGARDRRNNDIMDEFEEATNGK